ncbi:hypothetical protein PLESTB_000638600 [Pleodorina starrii]|uniref:Uncharacterized protein n=1 Tax=Pleodorina starrii TaxID=330485 RepID=A0A9W6BIA2_9CHLO|nr:hypothetical protein PLESTM_001300100 [Pleodorina starrii]GLC52518.1 hypothetical protein PLESTB_000638600 [Pleodorina starrii]GLC71518.1 hypothetical protein PLESTF_001130700 [Pleodorina starrii]
MDSLGDLSSSLPDTEESNPTPSTSFPTCTSPCVAPTVRQRNFVTQTHDAVLHFQILDLGRQYYVWVSAVGPKLGNLYLAIKTPADTSPAVASLLPASGAGGEGPAMAQRLALKLGRPVVCSCNMPQNAPLLQAVAERRLLQELQAMDAEGEQRQPQMQQTQQQQEEEGQQREELPSAKESERQPAAGEAVQASCG